MSALCPANESAQVKPQSRARCVWPYVAVAAVGVTHRLVLWYLYGPQLRALAAANPDWLTGQYLPIALLRDHALAALWFLQQTPPLPNVLMAVLLARFSWPIGVAEALIVLQGCIGVATSMLLTWMILFVYPGRRVLAAAVGAAFVLSTDLVVLEYNSLGQTIYENLAMLLTLCVLALLLLYWRTARTALAAAVGVAVALLALTRATWSFFALPCAVLLFAAAPAGRRVRAMLLYSVAVLLLQGGWSVKNWIVFGELSMRTSSWAGWNLGVGMRNSGFADEFTTFIHTHRSADGAPLHCIALELASPPPNPPEITARDQAVDAALGAPNSILNSNGFRYAADQCVEAVIAFCRAAPGTCVERAWRGYRLMWQPIANYGSKKFVNLFATDTAIQDSLDIRSVLALISARRLPDRQFVMSGTYPRVSRSPAEFYTPRWLDPLVLIAMVIGVHVLAPFLLILWAVRFLCGASGAALPRAAGVLTMAAGIYAYFAAVASIGDYGENMRFRLDVEPIIWLIALIAFVEIARMFGALLGRRVSAGIDGQT